MGKLFGTDGIRGRVNQHPMTPELALQTGKATALFFRKKNIQNRPKIVIGRDTRISGKMIESALVSGLCAMGADAYIAGVLPTPGVAYLTTHLCADAGIVVSASHNPFYDNGIKFFDHQGFKLNDSTENKIEDLILQGLDTSLEHIGDGDDKDIGTITQVTDPIDIYINFLVKSLPAAIRKKMAGKKVVLDCANGATSRVAPKLFSQLGLEIVSLANSPDGININDNCGSQHPQALSDCVTATHADIGFAFDGDGDRLVVVDEGGQSLTGDQIIAILAGYYQKAQLLKNNTVVTTVMSNMGFGNTMADMQINHIKSPVGDRYVMEHMVKAGAVVGGEDSGHIILLDAHTTGDGLLAALKFLHVLVSGKDPVSQLANVMSVYPQVLLNVTVTSKPSLETIPDLPQALKNVEIALEDSGRVLIRYSGTQPMCRIMVEAQSEDKATRYCKQLAQIIEKEIGA